MALKKYNKLIRDRMPGIIHANGNTPVLITISGQDLKSALADKLIEEAQEVKSATTDRNTIEELADVYELVRVLSRPFGGIRKIEYAADLKKAERGGFDYGVFMLEAEGDNLP